MNNAQNRKPAVSRTLLAAIAFALTVGQAYAGPKEDAHAEMSALVGQIQTTRSAGGDAASLSDRYAVLSASLGGDRPGESSSAGIAPRGAPQGPPSCAVTSPGGTSADTPIAVVDNTTITSTIALAGAPTFLHRVTVTINIDHTFAADLDIRLTSPAGTVTDLTTDSGGGNDNVFAPATFTDFGPIPVTDAVYTNLTSIGAVIPEGAMGAFRGENPNGNWVLSVGDDAGGDTGTLQSWSISTVAGNDVPTDVTSSFTSTNVPVAIVDNTVQTSVLTASGLDPYVCAVQLNTDITHTFASDLDISLISPATSTVITTDNGGGNDNVFSGTQWRDSAGSAATNFVYANLVTATPLIPEGAMGAFAGSDGNGIWTLSVGDDAGGDTGSINGWSLDVTTCSCALPSAFNLNTNTVAFGSVPTGSSSAPMFITLSNTGGGPGTVQAPTLTGPFSLSGGTCPAAPFDLGAGASCTYGIVFSAGTIGNATGSFTVNAGTDTLIATLSGTSALPPPAFIPANSGWMLGLLMGMLVLVAGFVIGKRRS